MRNKYFFHITGAACLGNFLLGTGKLVVGISSLSVFTCVSALYTYGMVLAKICALKGIDADIKKQYRHYRLTGIILIIASVLYGIYSARLLWHPRVSHYQMYVGLAIATFTFTEIGLNVRGVIVERHDRTLMTHAIKMVSLASSLISLVLTQTALLSFTHEDVADYDPSVSNGRMGIIMGSASAMLGVYMLIRVRRLERRRKQD